MVVGCWMWSCGSGIFPGSTLDDPGNLRTLLSFMNSHVDILLFLMDFGSVIIVVLPMDRCRKVRVYFMVPSGRTALICGSYIGMDG